MRGRHPQRGGGESNRMQTPPGGRYSVVMYRAVAVSLSSYRESNRCHSVARPALSWPGA